MSLPVEHSHTGRAIRSVAEALFYRGSPVPNERIDFIEREMLALLRASGLRARTLFVLCLFALVALAPLWVLRAPPLARLPLRTRIRALSRMEDSPLGAPLVLAVKAALCILYYEQPAAAAELGVVQSCLRQGALPPREVP